MNLKNEKGSITIFVLVGLLFMSAFLIISYGSNVNKSKVIKEQSDIMDNLYIKNENIVNSYQEVYAALRKNNVRTFSFLNEEDADKTIFENTNTVELTRTVEEKMSNYRIYGSGGQIKIVLPKEYQAVEYIESTGKQYIDTGVYMNPKIKIDLTMQLKYIDKDQKFFGSYGSGGICLGTLKGMWRFGNNMWVVNKGEAKLEKVNIQAYNDNWYINGENVATTKFSDNNKAPICLFGIYYDGSLFQKDQIKVYSLDIYEEDMLLRQFIPCYRISDNVVGLYDLVENKFYTNNGSDNFLKKDYIKQLGNLIEEETDENYGKYKIPIKISNTNNNESTIKNIYLEKPLEENEYIDLKLGKVIREDGTEETIELPEISTFEDYTKIEVLTQQVPSRIEVEYVGYTFE